MLGSTLLFVSLITIVMCDTYIDSFNNEFYVVSNGVGYYVVDSQNRHKPDKGQFWRTCEQIEMMEDAYEKSKSPTYKGIIGELINGLNTVISGTEDWSSWNNYNDDIMWGVIALVRSYQLTGNTNHLSQAEAQFNKVWARGWDQKDGGLYWSTQKQTKNACINCPATIAAFLLSQSTSNTVYKNQAIQIFNWLFKNLYNQTTGQIADHMNVANRQLVWWPFSYNQGTFMGAAVLYSQETGDKQYLQHATNAAGWSKAHLTGQHIANVLNDEDESRDGDVVGFKGVFARWCNKYIQVTGNQTIKDWLNFNAETAWGYRNTRGVTWTQWWHRTPDDNVTSWECSSAGSILQACDTCKE